ncbi:hypothetical protein MJ575_14130 [Klebsiella pneumoniae]|nr:hypothetical protein MJ575_14130 [Klebsiella pneumoniae]
MALFYSSYLRVKATSALSSFRRFEHPSGTELQVSFILFSIDACRPSRTIAQIRYCGQL